MWGKHLSFTFCFTAPSRKTVLWAGNNEIPADAHTHTQPAYTHTQPAYNEIPADAHIHTQPAYKCVEIQS